VAWTAGVKAAPLPPAFAVGMAGQGRVAVRPSLQHPEHPEVFFAGDVALPEASHRPLPMVAPVAMQQGLHAARGMLALADGREPEPFRYRDKGAMAVIGRGAAVSSIGGLHLTGFPAWLVWLFVHLLYLVGFRNRLMVLINWSADYFLFEKAVRLIMPKCLTRRSGGMDRTDPGAPG